MAFKQKQIKLQTGINKLKKGIKLRARPGTRTFRESARMRLRIVTEMMKEMTGAKSFAEMNRRNLVEVLSISKWVTKFTWYSEEGEMESHTINTYTGYAVAQ